MKEANGILEIYYIVIALSFRTKDLRIFVLVMRIIFDLYWTLFSQGRIKKAIGMRMERDRSSV